MYLTRDQLADWLGVAPTSYAAMARRLEAMGVPHTHIKGQCPRVLKTVHDALLKGERPVPIAGERPRFELIRAAS